MKTTNPLAVVRHSALVTFILLITTAGAQAAHFSALYAFGDSLSDLGNTYNVLGGMASDSAIYTEIGYTASAGRYDNGRWSNGPLWVEHLNDGLGLPSLQRNSGTQALPLGTNFAYGGSTTGTGATFFLLDNLQEQIANMISLAGGTVSGDSLYTVWSGGNDIIYYIDGNMPDTPAAIDTETTTMANNLQASLTALYNAGARHFLVPNLPALGDKPSYVNTPNQAFANAIVDSYNPKLAQMITDFTTSNPDAKIAAWDVFTLFNDLLANPGSYGFTNTTQAAFDDSGPYPGTVVADPNSHVFWDGTHPTAPAHAILGAHALEAVGALIEVPEPSAAILLLFSTTALSASRRRRAA